MTALPVSRESCPKEAQHRLTTAAKHRFLISMELLVNLQA